ncbi:hypothetical protein [Pigmentiphaga daeguensis]|uniref:Uncharacterized protein n=1 Tax=Pigmentiphaga daeguensis TaxID=414049 RepID=A0ABN1B8Z5_9BURK
MSEPRDLLTPTVPREQHQQVRRQRDTYERLYQQTLAELSEVKGKLHVLRESRPDAAALEEAQRQRDEAAIALQALVLSVTGTSSSALKAARLANDWLEGSGLLPKRPGGLP